MDQRKHYNRAVGIAEFILEGHSIKETSEEFRVSKDLVCRDLEFLAGYGYGEELRNNRILYLKAKKKIHNK